MYSHGPPYNGQNKGDIKNIGPLSNEPETEGPDGEEICKEVADFIQFVLTNKQPDDRFRHLYNETHRPWNVPALEEVQLNSVIKTDGCELEEEIAYAQNCMLKGVTKTVYVMDTLFKHVDKLPKELQLQQLMSDLNSAMKFFGAANIELGQTRKGEGTG